MNEPNYEYIGRCSVLASRINHKLDTLMRIKEAVFHSEFSHLNNAVLVLNHSAADCIEEAASNYRRILHEIADMAEEHNNYAPSAGVDSIAVRENNAIASGTKNHATENT